jgi:hypothetical protein
VSAVQQDTVLPLLQGGQLAAGEAEGAAEIIEERFPLMLCFNDIGHGTLPSVDDKKMA